MGSIICDVAEHSGIGVDARGLEIAVLEIAGTAELICVAQAVGDLGGKADPRSAVFFAVEDPGASHAVADVIALTGILDVELLALRIGQGETGIGNELRRVQWGGDFGCLGCAGGVGCRVRGRRGN